MIKIPFLYRDKLSLNMTYRDKVSMKMVMTPFTEKRNMDEPDAIMMVLIHNKLAFGVDRFLLGQVDVLTLGTIDPFPLDVR